MTFLLRAALVIGTLSYLASMRGQPGMPADGAGLGALVSAVEGALPTAIEGSPAARGTDGTTVGRLSAAWTAMPPDARRRVAQEAVAELGRRIAPAPATSRDTLADADRRAGWRGGEGR